MSGAPRTRYCSRCLTTFTTDVERCPNLGCRSVRPRTGWGELLEAGEMIDRTYRVHSRLAIGGAGVTYLGREVDAAGQEVGPHLAIKVLYQQRDQGPYLRRLAMEAQILQGLNHANIVECRGFVHRTGHSPYLVTRFEEGGSLLDHIRRVGTLPIKVVAEVGRQISWALDVAHRQGVVHRDLKPENVLLVRQVGREVTPEVRVADFGIAKVYGGVGERLTRVGAFVGTPQYAAPEQFEGLAPEPATDVYALGALLYFCLTARPVADFMAELDPESQRVHLLRHLPPRLDLPGVPPPVSRWMEQTLAIAMAVDPGDRCDLSTLDRRLAEIAAGRDPGFVRLPPVPAPLMTSATLSAEALVGVNSTDEVEAQPEPATGPKVVEWSPPPPPERAPPDPSAGTADPLGDPRRAVTPSRSPGATPPLVPAATPPPVPPSPPPVPSSPPPAPSSLPAPASPPPLPASPPPVPASPPAPASPPPIPPAAPPPVAAVKPPAPPPAAAAKPAAPPPTAAPPPSAKPAAPPPPAPKPARRGGGLGCMLGAVVLLGTAAALAGGAWFYLQPKADPPAPALTGKEKDPTQQRDWQLIASTLGTAGVSAEKACGTPPYLAIEATVDGSGKVTRVDLLNYDYEPARACIEKTLQAIHMPRAGTSTVRVAVTLQK